LYFIVTRIVEYEKLINARSHFDKDLEPYVCISEMCNEPPIYFSSIKQWYSHMNTIHTKQWSREIHKSKVWYCDLGHADKSCLKRFQSSDALKKHIQDEHEERVSVEILHSKVERNVIMISRARNVCPLCDEHISPFEESLRTPVVLFAAEEIKQTEDDLPKRDAKQLRISASKLSKNDRIWQPNSLYKTQGADIAKNVNSTGKEILTDDARSFGVDTDMVMELLSDEENSDYSDHDKVRSPKLFEDVEIGNEEPSSSISASPRERIPVSTDNKGLCRHVAQHLKSLAFISLRWFDDDCSSSGSEDSSRKLSSSSADTISRATFTPKVCDACNKEFTGQYAQRNLKRHNEQKHRTKESLECVCGKKFKRGDALLKHERASHPELGRQALVRRGKTVGTHVDK